MSQLKKPNKTGALYISYDGLLEPLGQSQIVPYVTTLAQSGIKIHVVSFERSPDRRDVPRLAGLRDRLETQGVHWTVLEYHRRPRILATLFDVIVGTWTCYRQAGRGGIRIVHARSYVPAFMALLLKWLTGVVFVFDMRGFWPEERVELGIFRQGGLLYRLCKELEGVLLRRADRLVVLTQRAKEILASRPEWCRRTQHIEVIPCCVDRSRFLHSGNARQLPEKLAGKWVVGNIGAINRRYLLPEMFRFFTSLKLLTPNVFFVYLTRQSPAEAEGIARQEGVHSEDLLVASASPDEIPWWLSQFQLGIFFLRPSYAAQATSSTKLGEFLAAGVPVVTNTGVGDVEQILSHGETGVLLPALTVDALQVAAREAASLMPLDADRRRACRCAAASHYDLKSGCHRYLSLYQGLLSTPAYASRGL